MALLFTHISFAQNRLFYAGNNGREVFNKVFTLSDGTYLMSGRASNLDWVPPTASRQLLSIPQVPSVTNDAIIGFNSVSNTGFAFIIHVAADMESIQSVVYFPENTVVDIDHIRTNTAPGEPTGNLFISGLRAGAVGNRASGWYMARLNNNFISGLPTGCVWYNDVSAKPRSTNQFSGPFANNGAPPDHAIYQPWDVQSDNKVVFVFGTEKEADWASIYRLREDGRTLDTIQYMPVHWAAITHKPQYGGFSATSELRVRNLATRGDSVWARTNPGVNPAVNDSAYIDSVLYSGLLLKVNRTGGTNLRSYSLAAFTDTTVDENGNAGRPHRYPDDLFYTTYCDGSDCPVDRGPGYTGYAPFNPNNNTATQRCVAVKIDRRNNDWYFGYSTYSSFEASPPHDFEPALVAMHSNGQLKWYARLYNEMAGSSLAGQVIDDIELDYSNNDVIVLGRSIDNFANNFWNGNTLVSKPGGNGFQNSFTGASDPNLEINWLGRYAMDTLQIKAATYVGEVAAGEPITNPYTAPLLDGWFNLNVGSRDLANTRVRHLLVMPDGSVALMGSTIGRTITTTNGFMPSIKPDLSLPNDSLLGENSFVRVYTPDFTTISYSSLVSSIYTPNLGTASGITINGLALNNDSTGLVLVGAHRTQAPTTVVPIGGSLPTVAVPAWGDVGPNNESAWTASLSLTDCNGNRPAKPSIILGPGSACANDTIVYRLSTPNTDATLGYAWALPGGNFSGYSNADTISVAVAPGAGGVLRVVAINECGTSEVTFVEVGAPSETPQPAIVGPTASEPHCVDACRTYFAINSPGATRYVWSLPGAGWMPASGNMADTVTLVDSIVICVSAGASSGPLRVSADGVCGLSRPALRNLPPPSTSPGIPTITETGNTLTSSALNGNQWLFNGSPIAGATARNYNNQGIEGEYRVVATNFCGSDTSAPLTVVSLNPHLALKNSMTLYPNPTVAEVNLQLEGTDNGPYTITVTDLRGRTLITQQFVKGGSSHIQPVSLRNLAAGTYLISVNNGKAQATKTIIKE